MAVMHCSVDRVSFGIGAFVGGIKMQNALYVEISALGIILLTIILVTQRQTKAVSAAQRDRKSVV